MSAMSEIWKDIPGYYGVYRVSDYGRVRSYICWRGTNERILKLAEDSHGYWGVCLYKQKKGKFTYIHQLVLLTFVGIRPDRMECRHLNDNKKDNRLVNLVYGTRSENLLDRTRNGIANTGDHKGIKNQMSKLTENDILQIRELLQAGILTQKEIGNRFDVTRGSISFIKLGKRWQHV